MKRFITMFLLAVILVLALLMAGLGVWFFHYGQEATDPMKELFNLREEKRGPLLLKPEQTTAAEKLYPAHLLFMEKNAEYLVRETRTLAAPDNATGQIRAVVEALARGPDNHEHVATVPAGTKVRQAFVDAATGLVYVDLSPEVGTLHPGGVRAEWATIYAIVNSIHLMDTEHYKKVQILINGDLAPTLAGNWDLSRPFSPDLAFVRDY